MKKMYEVVRIKQEIREAESQFDLRLNSPGAVAFLAEDLIGEEDREVLLVICLNSKNHINAVHRCHIGTLNSSVVHPREVFKSAILNNSASIILAHNHPSTEVYPSSADIEITKKVKQAGETLGIELLDHVIVSGTGKYLSIFEEGLL